MAFDPKYTYVDGSLAPNVNIFVYPFCQDLLPSRLSNGVVADVIAQDYLGR